MDFKKPCANKTPSFQSDSRGMWMPNCGGPCAVTHVTTNVHKTLMSVQSRNTLSKYTKKKARWVANLKRRLRQKWASRWTENPKRAVQAKLETLNKNGHPDRLRNPQRKSMQNLRIKGQASANQSKSKTRNRGNSKLLGRVVVTVFNVPFPYIYHFPNF